MGELVIAFAYVEDIAIASVVTLASAMGMVIALAFVEVGKPSMALPNLDSSQLASPLGHQHQGHFISFDYFYLKFKICRVI